MPFAWTPLSPADLKHVSDIARQVHRDFPEGDAVFAERLQLCPAGCWLLKVDDTPAGYLLSHPFPLGRLPALNSLLGEIPEGADSFYIHDLALMPAARGTGAAGSMVEQLAVSALDKGYARMSLVAVNSSQGFWTRHGFEVVNRPELASKLLSYEKAARFMVRESPVRRKSHLRRV